IDPFTGRVRPGLENLRGGAEAIAISADGKYVAVSQTPPQSLGAANKSASESQISGAAGGAIPIRIFEAATGRPFGQPIAPGGSASPGGSAMKMLLSPDGSHLVTLTPEAQLWKTATGEPVGRQRPDPVEESPQEPRQPNQAQKSPNPS